MSLIQLYHFTPTRNLASILATGLDPGHAREAWKTVWACTHARCDWAFSHVAEVHNLKPWALSLLTFRFPEERLASFSLEGVYRTGWYISHKILTQIPLHSLRSVSRQTGIAYATLLYWVRQGWVAGSFAAKGIPVFTDGDVLDVRACQGRILAARGSGLVR